MTDWRALWVPFPRATFGESASLWGLWIWRTRYVWGLDGEVKTSHCVHPVFIPIFTGFYHSERGGDKDWCWMTPICFWLVETTHTKHCNDESRISAMWPGSSMPRCSCAGSLRLWRDGIDLPSRACVCFTVGKSERLFKHTQTWQHTHTHWHRIDIWYNRYVMYANIPDVAQDSGEAQHEDSVVILACHGIICWGTLLRGPWKKAARNDAWTAKMLLCYILYIHALYKYQDMFTVAQKRYNWNAFFFSVFGGWGGAKPSLIHE